MSGDEETKQPPYWEQQDWEKSKVRKGVELYKGKYRVLVDEDEREFDGFVIVETIPAYSFEGIANSEQKKAKVYINNPPSEIRNHPNGSCLQLASEQKEQQNALFSLHFNKPPRDVDSAIRFMEEMLKESFHPNSKTK